MHPMRKPLAPWDYKEGVINSLVWFSRFDGRYQIEVQRTGEYTAMLCIFDHLNNDELLAEWNVNLAYAARFGPDVDDVRKWQEDIVTLIDTGIFPPP